MTIQGDMLLVVSADEDRIRRVGELARRDGNLAVQGITIPSDICEMMRDDVHIIGVVLDLTVPSSRRERRTADEIHNAWCVAALVALARSVKGVPLLIVSAFVPLESVLRQAGMLVLGQMTPDADDRAWRDALERLATTNERPPTEEASSGQGKMDASLSSSIIPIRTNLWLDLDSAILYHKERPIPLTAREAKALKLLMDVPRGYVSAAELARQLTRPGADYAMDDHSVEQMISNLRRKLGETGQQPHILVNKRGMGYALLSGDYKRLPQCAATVRTVSAKT